MSEAIQILKKRRQELVETRDAYKDSAKTHLRSAENAAGWVRTYDEKIADLDKDIELLSSSS